MSQQVCAMCSLTYNGCNSGPSTCTSLLRTSFLSSPLPEHVHLSTSYFLFSPLLLSIVHESAPRPGFKHKITIRDTVVLISASHLMGSHPFCQTFKVRPFVEHTLSPQIPITPPPQHFIPEKHPKRQFFPKNPIAYVNCGFIDGVDAGITPNVSLLTPRAAAVRVTNDLPYANIYNSELDDFVNSYRWHAKQVAYKVSVPKSGLYDVLVVFAETDVKFHDAKVHLLTVQVQAVQTYVKMDLNVFEQVGSDTPYLLCFTAIPVESDITITVYSTHDDGYAKLNGFIVTEFDPDNVIVHKPSDIVTVLDCGISRFDWDGLPSNASLLARENGYNRFVPFHVGAANPLLASLASTTRYSLHPLGYDIKVDHPGRYDVSLVFSEYKAIGVGKRKFDVHVGALDVFQKKSVDVYAEAGLRTPYVLTANDLRVDKKINVRITDELLGPIISGVIVSKACDPSNKRNKTEQPSTTPEIVSDDSYVTTINCGAGLTSPENDAGMADNVTVKGNPSRYVTDATIIGEDVFFMNMAKTFRYSNSELEYSIIPKKTEGVDSWDMAVVLCETVPNFLAVGKRLMTIEIVGEDIHRIEDIDVYKEVGAYRAKVIRLNGLKKGSRPDITIRFIKAGGAGAAIVCGIIVAPSAMNHRLLRDTPTPSAFVNCGVFGAYNANYDGGISENVDFTPVSVYGDAHIRMTGNKMLRDMCSVFRHGSYRYTIKVEKPGKYDVFLVFSEIYYNNATARVFDVLVEAKEKYEVKNLDVYDEVGKYRPLVLQLTDIEVEVTITIEGKQVTGNPIISGFLIYPAGVATRIEMPSFVADELVDVRIKGTANHPEETPDPSSITNDEAGKPQGSNVEESAPSIVIDCGIEKQNDVVSTTGVEDCEAGSVPISQRPKITEADPLKKELSNSYRSTSNGPFEYKISPLEEGTYRVSLIFCEFEEHELRVFTVSIEGIDEVTYPISFSKDDYMKVKVGSSIIQVQSSIKIKVLPGKECEGFLNGITISRIDNQQPSQTNEHVDLSTSETTGNMDQTDLETEGTNDQTNSQPIANPSGTSPTPGTGDNQDPSTSESNATSLPEPSTVLTPRQTFQMKPNDVFYLEPLCTLPVSITYSVTATKSLAQLVSCFTFNKRRDKSADALTWFLGTDSHDFTFRLFLHAKYAKGTRHRPGFLLPVNKSVQVECQIDKTEATYFVNGEKYATGKYSSSQVPQQGFFGFNTYGDSRAILRNFTIRMY